MVADSVKITGQLLDKAARKEIDNFLIPKKRRAVIYQLKEHGELTQGELAAAIGSTVTSLYNIIKAFDALSYRLFEVERTGKYRRYKLSVLGWSYVAESEENNSQSTDCFVSDLETRRLIQEAKESIDIFKMKNSDKGWELCLDEALRRRIDVGEQLDEKSELLVDQYLRCIELLAIRGDFDAHDQVLDMLTNAIHRERVERFMDQFEPFIAILQYLADGGKAIHICKILKSVFGVQPDSTVEPHIEAAGWKDDEYYKLKQIAPKLRNRIAGYSEDEIVQFFDRLLPGQGILSCYLAELLHNRNNP